MTETPWSELARLARFEERRARERQWAREDAIEIGRGVVGCQTMIADYGNAAKPKEPELTERELIDRATRLACQ